MLMRKLGKSSEKLEHFNSIDEKEFVDLVADILYVCLRHRNVKIMDGPGDGTRDIYSIDRKGNECITQCKYHKDYNKSVSSPETNQLIIGLNKFGYSKGIFATNARISPQAKRESKDNFKNFDLEYFDGTELNDYLKSNPLLSIVWLEGVSISHGIDIISVPVLIRDYHSNVAINDIDIDIESYDFKVDEDIRVNVSKEFVSLERFEPYELPENRSFREGWNSSAITLKFDFIGKVKLHLIDKYIDWIKKYIYECVKNGDFNINTCLRFGVPTVEYGNERWERKAVVLPIYDAFSVIMDSNNSKYKSEVAWHSINLENWKRPARISMSQLSFFRLYNYNFDLCLRVEYIGGISPKDKLKFKERETYRRIMWENSIFILGEKRELEKLVGRIKVSIDYSFNIFNNLYLYYWAHPECGLRPSIEGDIEEYKQRVLSTNFLEFKTTVEKFTKNENVEFLSSERALHLTRSTGFDPLISSKQCHYRTVDYLDFLDSIPSPLLSGNRVFTYETVYAYEYDYSSRTEVEELLSDSIELISNIDQKVDLEFIIDEDYRSGFYLIIEFRLDYDNSLSNEEIVLEHEKQLENYLEKISKIISSSHDMVRKYTNQYWLNEYGVFL
ncbi:MAG: restriction endonuclease [Firmicutes bacterium]|nr:restriction endonuclease [Bacillota bacterium]